jgi:hypothetical protein
LPDIPYIHFWLEANRSSHGLNTMQHIWPHGWDSLSKTVHKPLNGTRHHKATKAQSGSGHWPWCLFSNHCIVVVIVLAFRLDTSRVLITCYLLGLSVKSTL